MSELQAAVGRTLVFLNGSSVTLKQYGTDEEGEYLMLEHRMVRPGAVNGPHLHPVLQERFIIKEGSMRFRRDEEELVAGPGESIVISPGQIHQIWNESEGELRAMHEIRPAGRHWDMFELLYRLEAAGKLNSRGIPRNPLWIGLAWKSMDGYIAGPPVWLQRIVLGGLAKLAETMGYRI